MDPLLRKLYGIRKEDIADYEKYLMLGGGTRPAPTIIRGKGVWLTDIDGKKYIDCTSQSWAMYLGFANEEFNATITEHLKNASHIHQGFDTPSRFMLAKKLAEKAPKKINRVSFTVGGAAAVEGGMKIAIKNRENAQEFITLYDAYHGTTLGVMGSSWVSTKSSGKFMGGARFNRLTRQFVRVPNPYCYRCPLELKRENCGMICLKLLKITIEKAVNGPVAGLIMEPLQASGGQIIFPKEYLEGARKICDDYGIPLIWDEIQTYCRIGTWFASGYYGVEPDIICLGKGLGGGFPIAATMISDDLEGFSPDTEELHTFANNTVSQVAALKQIEMLEQGILDNCNTMGNYLGGELTKMRKDFPRMGDVRQAGLHIGVELVRDPVTREADAELLQAVRNYAMENGVIFGVGGMLKNVLKVKPPFIITKEECDIILEVLRRALKHAGL
ncbi:MAG: aminotransferase class III-fold pyridoxal phosphate-dependent enzyme [Spirochaetales bacterium]|nr:MAG: aminotransferase class III-fold pyridoxal phosphate-dependent enzyme [Spirochaetales bacterium]